MDIEKLAGTRLGNYKIESLLGRGGMGVVYKARQISLNRPVALKFLPSELTRSHEWKERFLREAQAAAALSHPNICTIHEIDQTGDQAFIAMEYIDGKSLQDRIESGPLGIEEAIDISIQVSQGLHEAHEKGIIHRDIKSANIMLTARGQAKIMDFGLAKLSGRTRLTGTATIMGTVAYMSPEQARGDKDIGHQTDIWSLGVVLYEMLTGKLPFDAETDTGLIYRIIHEDPEPIRNYRSDIPGSLASIDEKTMQKDPQNRYQDTEELIADLEVVKSGPSISTERSSPSIVVLPFINMSADPEQEYFCDGLAEDLINALTKLQDLRVIARTSAFSFKGQSLDVRDIGRRLDVQAVLEGSVRKAGNRLRITAQLVDTARGYHLWSEQYNREMADVFAIQDEITHAIVDELKPRLLTGEKEKLAKRQIVDLEAYNLYLKGRYFLDKNSEEALRKSIEYYKQAIERVSDYALAYSDLACAYSILPFFGPSFPVREAHSKASQAALKALEIDEDLGEAHTRLAYVKSVYEWDSKGAENEFKKAIELNPGYADTHLNYSIHLMHRGRFDEAFEEIRKALNLDPLSLAINREAAIIFYFAGQYDQTISAIQKTIEMDPNFPYVHMLLGFAYLQNGMPEKGIEEFEKEKEVLGSSHPVLKVMDGYMHALSGKIDLAKKVLECSKEEYAPPFLIAGLCFFLGEDDAGFEWLNKAFEERDLFLSYLKVHIAFDSVRSDPRYISMLKKIGLAD